MTLLCLDVCRNMKLIKYNRKFLMAQLVDIMEVMQLHTKSSILDTTGQHFLMILMLTSESARSAKLLLEKRGKSPYYSNSKN